MSALLLIVELRACEFVLGVFFYSSRNFTRLFTVYARCDLSELLKHSPRGTRVILTKKKKNCRSKTFPHRERLASTSFDWAGKRVDGRPPVACMGCAAARAAGFRLETTLSDASCCSPLPPGQLDGADADPLPPPPPPAAAAPPYGLGGWQSAAHAFAPPPPQPLHQPSPPVPPPPAHAAPPQQQQQPQQPQQQPQRPPPPPALWASPAPHASGVPSSPGAPAGENPFTPQTVKWYCFAALATAGAAGLHARTLYERCVAIGYTPQGASDPVASFVGALQSDGTFYRVASRTYALSRLLRNLPQYQGAAQPPPSPKRRGPGRPKAFGKQESASPSGNGGGSGWGYSPSVEDSPTLFGPGGRPLRAAAVAAQANIAGVKDAEDLRRVPNAAATAASYLPPSPLGLAGSFLSPPTAAHGAHGGYAGGSGGFGGGGAAAAAQPNQPSPAPQPHTSGHWIPPPALIASLKRPAPPGPFVPFPPFRGRLQRLDADAAIEHSAAAAAEEARAHAAATEAAAAAAEAVAAVNAAGGFDDGGGGGDGATEEAAKEEAHGRDAAGGDAAADTQNGGDAGMGGSALGSATATASAPPPPDAPRPLKSRRLVAPPPPPPLPTRLPPVFVLRHAGFERLTQPLEPATIHPRHSLLWLDCASRQVVFRAGRTAGAAVLNGRSVEPFATVSLHPGCSLTLSAADYWRGERLTPPPQTAAAQAQQAQLAQQAAAAAARAAQHSAATAGQHAAWLAAGGGGGGSGGGAFAVPPWRGGLGGGGAAASPLSSPQPPPSARNAYNPDCMDNNAEVQHARLATFAELDSSLSSLLSAPIPPGFVIRRWREEKRPQPGATDGRRMGLFFFVDGAEEAAPHETTPAPSTQVLAVVALESSKYHPKYTARGLNCALHGATRCAVVICSACTDVSSPTPPPPQFTAHALALAKSRPPLVTTKTRREVVDFLASCVAPGGQAAALALLQPPPPRPPPAAAAAATSAPQPPPAAAVGAPAQTPAEAVASTKVAGGVVPPQAQAAQQDVTPPQAQAGQNGGEGVRAEQLNGHAAVHDATMTDAP